MDVKQAALYLANNLATTMLAVIAIAGVVSKIKPIGNSIKRFLFAELYTANEKQDKRLDNLEMWQLKTIICDRRLPIGERLNAGDIYLDRGGNGEIKMICESLQEAAKKKLLEEQEQRDQREQEKRRAV